MRFSPTKFIPGLLLLTSLLLAACGGGGGGSTGGGVVTVTPPAAPTGVSATDVTGCYARIRIDWTPATGATSYKIYRSTAPGVALTSPVATLVTASPYTDADPTLSASTTYYYKVTAVNSGGESSGSSEVTLTTGTLATCTNTGGSQQGNALVLTTAVTTLAGSAGFPGTADGTGTGAQFFGPQGVTTDGTNLYVADTGKHTIRKIVIATGAVTTLAGAAGVSGTTTDVTGAAARFNGPEGITTDGTNLYVADTQNGSIRKIVITTGAVTTLVPTSTFSLPAGITFDGVDLYVADTGNHNIRKVTLLGVITPFAGTGVAGFLDHATGTSAQFNSPRGITSDGANLYVADTANQRIRVVALPGGGVTTLAGNGTAGFLDHATGTSAQFNFPQGITTDGTNLYVADTANHRIRMINGAGAVTTIAGDGTGGNLDSSTGASARFYSPSGITTDGTSLFDADTTNNTIRMIH